MPTELVLSLRAECLGWDRGGPLPHRRRRRHPQPSTIGNAGSGALWILGPHPSDPGSSPGGGIFGKSCDSAVCIGNQSGPTSQTQLTTQGTIQEYRQQGTTEVLQAPLPCELKSRDISGEIGLRRMAEFCSQPLQGPASETEPWWDLLRHPL
jgi:hypothetical protein